jgi:hypothetical protein
VCWRTHCTVWYDTVPRLLCWADGCEAVRCKLAGPRRCWRLAERLGLQELAVGATARRSCVTHAWHATEATLSQRNTVLDRMRGPHGPSHTQVMGVPNYPGLASAPRCNVTGWPERWWCLTLCLSLQCATRPSMGPVCRFREAYAPAGHAQHAQGSRSKLGCPQDLSLCGSRSTSGIRLGSPVDVLFGAPTEPSPPQFAKKSSSMVAALLRTIVVRSA